MSAGCRRPGEKVGALYNLSNINQRSLRTAYQAGRVRTPNFPKTSSLIPGFCREYRRLDDPISFFGTAAYKRFIETLRTVLAHIVL
jgi:hypothetical protein